ncbi:MAG: hypothetical protein JNM22_16805 [Saprospiraceae bacterium]|nr:hypothetical protein [Saprospiraceae bacterium]
MTKRFADSWRTRLIWFSGGVLLASLLAFSFEEEGRYCVIGLDKMNVLYQGIDNPMKILVRGVPQGEVKIETEGVMLGAQSGPYYVARAGASPTAKVRISGGQLKPTEFTFRVKRFPDPELYLGSKRGGVMGNGEFRAQMGISAVITCCDFDAKCEVASYDVVHIVPSRTAVRVTNKGARYTPEVRPLIDAAKPGHTYIFDDVKVRCPGDQIARTLGPMTFKIK